MPHVTTDANFCNQFALFAVNVVGDEMLHKNMR